MHAYMDVEVWGVTLGVLTALEVPIELVADRCPGKMLGSYVASSLEEMELLNRDIVCIIAIWNGAEKEKERLKKHFYTVVEMENFGTQILYELLYS